MKRSEALLIIKHTIESAQYMTTNSKYTAEKLLKVIENDIGMLPPEYTGDSYDMPEWEKEAIAEVESTHCRGIDCEFCLPDSCPFCKDKPCGKSWCSYTKGCK